MPRQEMEEFCIPMDLVRSWHCFNLIHFKLSIYCSWVLCLACLCFSTWKHYLRVLTPMLIRRRRVFIFAFHFLCCNIEYQPDFHWPAANPYIGELGFNVGNVTAGSTVSPSSISSGNSSSSLSYNMSPYNNIASQSTRGSKSQSALHAINGKWQHLFNIYLTLRCYKILSLIFSNTMIAV